VKDLRAALQVQGNIDERKPVSSASSEPAPVLRQA
jgi:hypothetical protein